MNILEHIFLAGELQRSIVTVGAETFQRVARFVLPNGTLNIGLPVEGRVWERQLANGAFVPVEQDFNLERDFIAALLANNGFQNRA